MIPMFKQLIATAATASLLVVFAPSPVDAHHRPKRYCSESGDICQSVTKVDGVRRLRIVTQERYFEVFHLCVYSHRDEYEWCAPYRLRERADGTFGRSVAWFKRWPSMRSPGAFTVSWWVDDDRIGRVLGFHIR